MKSKKYLNFLTSIILIAGMILGSISVGFAADLSAGGQFGDINGHWAKAQIESGVANGFIKGYADSTFKPDNNITRAEFFTMVNRAFGYTEKADVDYSDVSKENWFYSEIAKAKATGYVAGYTDGTIKPNNNITREEAAAIITRIMDLSEAKDASVLNKFSDSVRFADWSKGYIGAIAQEGYMGGYPDGTFKSERNITRAESVSMLNRVVGALYKTAGTYGSESEKTVIEGNVTISTTGVVLKNMEIKGNLYLTEGIGDGDFTMDNVEVAGKTLVKGGGPNSIVVLNSKLGIVIVNTKTGTVRVVAKGNSSVGRVVLNSGAKLEEDGVTGDGFGNVDLSLNIPEGEEVIFVGDFAEVKVAAPGVKVNVVSGTIGKMEIAAEAKGATVALGAGAKVTTMTINAAVAVTGKGEIGTAIVNVNEVTMEQKPDNVQKGDNVEFNPGPGTTSGSGGPTGGDSNSGSTKSITITSINDVSVRAEETIDVTASVEPADATIAAESADTGIATVSVSGNKLTITGVSAGQTTITVTATKADYTTDTEQFTVTVKRALVAAPVDHTLPALLDAIEDAFSSLTDEEWNSLQQLQANLTSSSVDEIVASMQQAGLVGPFEALINDNISEQQARVAVNLILAFADLGRDNASESINTISAKIADLKAAYSNQVTKLIQDGVNQEEIYDYAIDVYDALLQDPNISSVSDADYEEYLYNEALDVLRNNSEHSNLETVVSNAFDRAYDYYASKLGDLADLIKDVYQFDNLTGAKVIDLKKIVEGQQNDDISAMLDLLDFMLDTSKLFVQ
ncbi:S-layer homology domain-containing protein [Petroclostridium sp. X23]|uniref:S-layer homology domain-containing protein n=1 Tax=Petroclostridium sp. X23 TaxID=3045146 RepID=UPI0024ADF07F|nr:S-layer homology domain-containing protein [Petroclostridium sp. X23]WHH57524.1 S-layer homology domain-containing protein [Petroclostridium sp. X23]